MRQPQCTSPKEIYIPDAGRGSCISPCRGRPVALHRILCAASDSAPVTVHVTKAFHGARIPQLRGFPEQPERFLKTLFSETNDSELIQRAGTSLRRNFPEKLLCTLLIALGSLTAEMKPAEPVLREGVSAARGLPVPVSRVTEALRDAAPGLIKVPEPPL